MSSVYNSSSSSYDSLSDNEFISVLNSYKFIPAPCKKRKYSERENVFEKFSEEEFEYRFRLSKALELMERIYKSEGCMKSSRATRIALKPLEKILITLRYYATSSFQIMSADLFSVDRSTISRIVCEVSKKIAHLAKEDITTPATEDERNIENIKFFEMHGVPNVVGSIDCTHVPIQSPGGDRSESFRNRKSWFSINVQIVCDHDMRIIDIVSRWPGSCHDQKILNFSKLQFEFEIGKFQHSFLIGDSGYACKKYIIMPLSNPQSRAEIKYNAALISTRQIIERTIGVWKRRFPVLGIKCRLNVLNTLNVIVATAALHNMLRKSDMPPLEVEMEPLPQPNFRVSPEECSDFSTRNYVILHTALFYVI